MELNDLMDLNAMELFDDTNDSFDNEEGNNSETIIIDTDDDNFKMKYPSNNEPSSIILDDVISSDAVQTSTELVSLNLNFVILTGLFRSLFISGLISIVPFNTFFISTNFHLLKMKSKTA